LTACYQITEKELNERLHNDLRRTLLAPFVTQFIQNFHASEAVNAVADEVSVMKNAENEPSQIPDDAMETDATVPIANAPTFKHKEDVIQSLFSRKPQTLPSFRKKKIPAIRAYQRKRTQSSDSDDRSDSDGGSNDSDEDDGRKKYQKSHRRTKTSRSKTNIHLREFLYSSSDESEDDTEQADLEQNVKLVQNENVETSLKPELSRGSSVTPSDMDVDEAKVDGMEPVAKMEVDDTSVAGLSIPVEEEENLYMSLMRAQRELATKKKTRGSTKPKAGDAGASLSLEKKKEAVESKKKKKKVVKTSEVESNTPKLFIPQKRAPIVFSKPDKDILDLLEPFDWPLSPPSSVAGDNISATEMDVDLSDVECESDASLDFTDIDLTSGFIGPDRREEDLEFLRKVVVLEKELRREKRNQKRRDRGLPPGMLSSKKFSYPFNNHTCIY
jgi:hypothetical protein